MGMILVFARTYPWQSLAVLVALLFSGLAEGVSLMALLPMLTTALNDSHGGANTIHGDNDPAHMLAGILRDWGISPGVGVLLTIVVLGTVLKSLLVLVANKRVGDMVAQVATDLRLALLRALSFARWEYYLRQPVGSLANAMSGESSRASTAYLEGATLVALLVQLVVSSAVALAISWKATLAYLAVGSVLLVTLHRFVRMARRAGKRRTKMYKSMLRRLADTLQSVKPLKAMAYEDLADTVLSAETRKLNKAMKLEVFSKEALKAIQDPTFIIIVAIGFYVGLVYLRLPAANVIVLVMLLSRVLKNLGRIQRQYQNLVACEASFWSVQHTIEEARREVEPSVGRKVPHFREAVRLDQASFSYARREVLHDVSLAIPVGSMTAIVGASGAGKTTLVDLLIGLLRPTSGRIWVDNLPLEEIDLRQWRRLIGYVPQESLLLHDSVYHNVTLGHPELDERDAERALRAAEAWDFVAELPQGLHTSVGERGTMLSGGQRQRVMIARALAHRRKLLILDEPTSALDPASEAAVANTLRHLRGEITLVVISHQPALVEAADCVYRLEKGHLALQGDRTVIRNPAITAHDKL